MENYIGLNIKHLCVKNKLSQEAFGELFGLQKARISTYTSGRSNPPVEILQQICQHFKITLDEFVNADLDNTVNSTPPKIINTVEETSTGYNDKTMVIEAQKETITSLREQISLLKDKVEMLETKAARAS